MAIKEEELVEKVMKENGEFSKAKQMHAELSQQLDEFERKPFLTPQEEIEIKVLKKRKLACKDQMEKILIQFR